MVANDSFNQYLDRAVRHYASLFTLPSYKKSLMLSALVCLTVGLLYVLVLHRSLLGLTRGLLLGVMLVASTVLSNYFLGFYVFKKDPVYDLRRVAAFSLFCWVLWLFFILMGCAVSFFSDSTWAIRLCLLGFSAVLILRFIVLYVTSSSGVGCFLVASIVPPLFCLMPFMVFWINLANFLRISIFLLYAIGIALLSSFLFIALLNNVGKQAVGFPPLSIFKAFLLNWIADLNKPFEIYLESLSNESDVRVSIIRFEGETNNVFMIVPSVHPGPFKNIGSSFLPSMLKTGVERKFGGVACVLLGLLGHEFDLASQNESQKIIDYVVESAVFKAEEHNATHFVKVRNELATTCCQIFGKTALITFSLAPNTTEDLPQELGSAIQRKAEKFRLEECVFVNAHNSINGTLDSKQALEALESTAMACLEKAVSMEKLPFKIGAATVMPKEFKLSDGMGPGGITVVVVEVAGRKTAYVVFDGNNMVSGLREKILLALQSIGIDDGEVFTTDTHSVNAVTLSARGYHPIGEVMNHERLIEYVTEAARNALANLSQAKVKFSYVQIPRVKVIGRESLEKLCMLPDMVVRRAKRIVAPLFIATSLLLMLFLLLV
ncbi:MAG: DUF2070 family protein [Candidatus Bathyarchaeota archaeon]|nr:DUF2070 family protein [Candidatus Bathyarchaeota archaeon]